MTVVLRNGCPSSLCARACRPTDQSWLRFRFLTRSSSFYSSSSCSEFSIPYSRLRATYGGSIVFYIWSLTQSWLTHEGEKKKKGRERKTIEKKRRETSSDPFHLFTLSSIGKSLPDVCASNTGQATPPPRPRPPPYRPPTAACPNTTAATRAAAT